MKLFIQLIITCMFAQAIIAQSVTTVPGSPNSWNRKADFGGAARYGAVAFSIGNKGYLGTGSDNAGSYTKDLWEYNPDDDTWTQKADFGGTARRQATGFSIGSKGYLGTGSYGFVYYKDFWEYDPVANTWARKADFDGPGREGAVGFSINSKGYMGTGHAYDGAEIYYKDFWEYDPAANTWAQKSNFAGTPRSYAAGFSIGSKGYLGTGFDNNHNVTKDFWEYDPVANKWFPKADAFVTNGAVGFSIGSKGYIGTGGSEPSSFWEYDVAANSWWQKADFGGTGRQGAVGFSIGDKGYLGTGSAYTLEKDFWEYTPDTINIGIPTITSFTPVSGPVGKTVNITGTNFNANPAGNIVYFGATRAKVTAASTVSLTVNVPAGATYEPITVTANNLTGYSGQPFLVTFDGGGIIDANSFAAAVTFPMGSNPDQMALADMDGNGKADMIVGSYGESALPQNAVAVFRNTSNTGTIAFAPKIELLKGSGQTYPVTADFDGDGKIDLAVMDSRLEKLTIFINKSTPGNISLVQQVEYTTGEFPYSIGKGDIDGDGKPDIVIPNLNGKNFSVYRNTSSAGSISLASKIDFPLPLKPLSIAIGDLDKDGKADVVIGYTDYNNYVISVFRNTSSPEAISFDSKIDLPNNEDGYTSGISIGDLDGDGNADITVSNFSNSASTISLFRNTGSAGLISFAPKVSFSTNGSGFQNNSINDLDGDGKPDLAGGNYWSGTLAVLKNLSTPGTLSFAESVNYPSGSGPKGTSAGDVDGDGRPDIIYLNLFSETIAILRNQIGSKTCAVPTALRVAKITDTSVMLRWASPVGPVSGYKIRYRAVGSQAVIKRNVKGTINNVLLCGLLPNTTYEWQIRSNCTEDTSAWVCGPNFTTAASFLSSTNSANNIFSKVPVNIGVQILPNPSNGNFTLQMQLPSKDALTTLALYNSLGERIWQQQAGMVNGVITKSIAMENKLPAGIYILRIERSDIQLMQKVVVRK